MRLIDADRINYDIYEDDSGTKFVVIRIDDLSQIPTVEAEPVRHGKWIYIDDDIVTDKPIFRCSECGKISADRGKYCSNCGAKMDGESEV